MDLLTRLQTWYRSNCDGDWKHTYGILIDNLDNPSWTLIVDLEETDTGELTFEPVRVDHSAEDWYHCSVRDGKFKGAGGAGNLVDLLRTFLDWAEQGEAGTTGAAGDRTRDS